ncbi:MAG: FAD:protein FMN transferase [Candidatus Dormibacteraceae bacterium]
MGTTVTALLPAAHCRLAVVVENLFRSWEDRMSRFLPDSELSRLNARAGESVRVSRLLYDVVDAALGAANATAGVFDPTMLLQIRGIGYDRTFGDILVGGATAYRPQTGGKWREVRLDPDRRTVQLPEGAGLDLGGIAKGMAVDAAAARLLELGASPAAVDAGGDLAVLGLPDGYDSWPIAIETNGKPRVVSLSAGGLATSSVGRRHWRQGGVERHHLLDPRTGLPVENEVWSASVAADSCRAAEIAAKAALLLGHLQGVSYLEQHDLPGLLVLKDGRQILAGPWSPQKAGSECSRQAN